MQPIDIEAILKKYSQGQNKSQDSIPQTEHSASYQPYQASFLPKQEYRSFEPTSQYEPFAHPYSAHNAGSGNSLSMTKEVSGDKQTNKTQGKTQFKYSPNNFSTKFTSYQTQNSTNPLNTQNYQENLTLKKPNSIKTQQNVPQIFDNTNLNQIQTSQTQILSQNPTYLFPWQQNINKLQQQSSKYPYQIQQQPSQHSHQQSNSYYFTHFRPSPLTLDQKHYQTTSTSNIFQPPKTPITAINNLTTFTHQYFDQQPPSNSIINYDKPPQIIVPDVQTMEVFSSSKQFQSTANYGVNAINGVNGISGVNGLNGSRSNHYNRQLKDEKPSLESNDNSLRKSQFSTRLNSNYPKQANINPFNYALSQYSTQHYNKLPHSNAQKSLFSYQPVLPQTQQKKQPQPNQPSTVNYRQVNPSTSAKPNKQGFIPLQMTKQQMQYTGWDINSVEMSDKRVYDRLQVTCKMKSKNEKEFESGFCGWRKAVMYDISTKDDEKGKGFWGKWC